LEQRKAGVTFNQVVLPSPETCPGRGTVSGAVVIVTGSVVSFDGPEGTVEPFDAGPLDPMDRPQGVARWIVSLFAAQLRGRRPPTVDFPVVVATSKPAGVSIAGTVAVGGVYEYQPGPGLHTGLVEVLGGLSMYDERLWVGLRLGYQPATQVPRSSLGAKVQAVPFSAQVRGGLVFDPVVLRLGFGVGMEWRRVAFGDGVVKGERIQSKVIPVLEGEVEIMARLPGSMRLSVAGTVRGFLSGDGFTMHDKVDYDPPRYSVGALLRLGIIFPRPQARR